MPTVTLNSLDVDGKWAVFLDGADLSEYSPDDIKVWSFETKPVTTGSLIRTIDAVSVRAESPAYSLAYNLAFANEHCESVTGPLASPKPDADFWEVFPTNVLVAYVGRADTTRSVSEAELSAKKLKRPEAAKSEPTD